MEDEKKREDFDPSKTDAFQKTLSRAFEPEIMETEAIDITTEDSSSILTITEDGIVDSTEGKEGKEKEEKERDERGKDKSGKAEREKDESGNADREGEEGQSEEGIQLDLSVIEGMLAAEIEKEEEKEQKKQKKEQEKQKKEQEKEEEEALPVIQTDFDFEDEIPQAAEVDDAVLESISNQLASQVAGGYSEERKPARERRIPIWMVSVGVTLASLVLIIVFLFCTGIGRNILLDTKFGKYIISHVGGMIFEDATTFDPGILLAEPFIIPITPTPSIGPDPTAAPEITITEAPEPTEEPKPTQEPEPTEEAEMPQTVYHILILGMDEVEGETPNADLLILATLNTEKNEITLTTLLRNLLVQVPGRMDDKLGSVYSEGGIGLMYDVLEASLGIRPDGYLLFNYNGFEQIIDILGGVSMSITAKEADYLNKTNYITLPENRNLTAGLKHLNGDQALGYCRIRHVGTEDNEYNDIGRASRCRRLIAAVFEQYKSKGMAELYKVTKQCLSYIVTDITGEECTEYLEAILNMDGVKVSNYRIPVEGTYQASIIRGSSVLVPDMGQNRILWQEFVSIENKENGEASEGE